MKPKRRKQLKKKSMQPQAPLSPKEAEKKIRVIRAKLLDMKEYKAILAEDGLKPDEEDKRRESELIIRLLRLEKTPGLVKEDEAPWRGKAGGKPDSGKPNSGKPGAGKPRGPNPGGYGKSGAKKSKPAGDSGPKTRDRRPNEDRPARTEKKFRDDERPAPRGPKQNDRPTRTEKTVRDDDRPVPREDRSREARSREARLREDNSREAKSENSRPNRDNKKTINRGGKPSGAKKSDDKKGPKGPKGPKKAGGKPARRPFVKKTKDKE